jgi:hypothetical protein
MHPDILGEQISIGAAIAWVIERAKQSNWRALNWITPTTDKLNRVLSVLAAVAATAGLHFTMDYQAGALTVTGLTGGNLQHFAWEAFKVFVFQEGSYRAMLKK